MPIWTIPGGWLELRRLNGHDVRSVEGASVFDALALIDRLNVGRHGGLAAAGQASELAAAVRDRVLAWIYAQNYGDAITSSPRCASCGERYDLSFSLADLLAAHPIAPLPPDGVYQTASGARFRLPTGANELAVVGMPADAARRELLRRCILGGHGDPNVVEAAMEAAAPLLNMELQPICPECGAAQAIGFDMGTYLLRRLLSEKQRLPDEAHMLAMAYGWSHSEILNLTRPERRRFITLIEASYRESRARGARGARRMVV
jgi:hypothetical protein